MADSRGGISVSMVGTGGGIAGDRQSLRRNGPAVLIQSGEVSLLFDTGRNALTGLHDLDFDPAGITHLVFTHYHSDHTLGLPDLVLSTWVASGRSSWSVIGPVGANSLLDRLFGPRGAFRPDIEARAFGASSNALFRQRLGKVLTPPTFDVTEVGREGRVVSGPRWRLDASFAPDHVQPMLTSVAYRFTTDRGSVVVVGDTGPNDAVASFSRDTDLLIHDCTMLERHGVYREQQVHTDAESLGRVAAAANARAVIGTHVTRAVDRPELLDQFPERVGRSYNGQFKMAYDGLNVRIDDSRIDFLPGGPTWTASGQGDQRKEADEQSKRDELRQLE